MSSEDLIAGMNAYYAKRAPLHDGFMGYTGNVTMEELLGPVIAWVEDDVRGRDVLEVACGTGNWTQVLAKRARSVVATDVNEAVLEIARTKAYASHLVRFEVADAYALETVEGTFNAGFAADWWSHIPKSAVRAFATGLVRKLEAESRVVLIDMLPTEELNRMFSHYDEEGNLIHRRRFVDGQVFEVVKNFPTQDDLVEAFRGIADGLDYREHDGLRRWVLTLTTRGAA